MLFIVRHILWFSFLSRYVYFCFFYSVDSRCVETLRTQVKISFSFQENKINQMKIRLKPLEFNNCWMAILWLYDIINVIKWNFIGQHYVVLAILREFFLLFREISKFVRFSQENGIFLILGDFIIFVTAIGLAVFLLDFCFGFCPYQLWKMIDRIWIESNCFDIAIEIWFIKYSTIRTWSSNGIFSLFKPF